MVRSQMVTTTVCLTISPGTQLLPGNQLTEGFGNDNFQVKDNISNNRDLIDVTCADLPTTKSSEVGRPKRCLKPVDRLVVGNPSGWHFNRAKERK